MYLNAAAMRRERMIAGASAFGMHLLFFALLVFGVSWQKTMEPSVNMVDLWAQLPSRPEPKVEPTPEPPAPQPVARVEPPPKPAPRPDAAKPDIALKEKTEKAEKERRLIEQKKAEQKMAEAKKREEEVLAAQKQQMAREAAEALRIAKEKEDAERKLAEQAAAARVALIEKYKSAIRDKIRRHLILPPNVQGNPEVEFDVVIAPSGNVITVKRKRSSGYEAYDSAVERAVERAQPLPLPADQSLIREFRELNLRFRPQE